MRMMVPSISSISTTLTCFGKKIGKVTETPEMMVMATIADLLNPITGTVPNNADNLGNAEELECAKEVDSALDMMVASNHHSHNNLLVFSQIADQM
jgi:hypothetical protein